MGQKFFDMHESSRLNMSFKCSGSFNIIHLMRTKSLIYKVFLFYGAHLYLRRATDLVADPFPHIALVI